MAKHPHRLLLMNKKTWRCTLEGCGFFVHLGLAHVLEGKTGICWNCGEQFTITAQSLKNEMPNCDDCRDGTAGRPSLSDREEYINTRMALGKAGVKHPDDLSPTQINTMKSMGVITDKGLEQVRRIFQELAPSRKPVQKEEEDQIEVIEADEEHAPDCDVFSGGDCTCK